MLYTGDFSRQEDRHLRIAEIPHIRPDILMIESTYGVSIHEPRESREFRFTNTVQTIVNRGGRCLIPVFALGRAQELLLILGTVELWKICLMFIQDIERPIEEKNKILIKYICKKMTCTLCIGIILCCVNCKMCVY